MPRFTDSYLSSQKATGTPYKRRDTGVEFKGFGVQVSRAGRLSFFQSGTVNAKQLFVTLGFYVPPDRHSGTDSNLADMRSKAREIYALIDNGIDPRAWLRQQEETTFAVGSIKDLMTFYIESLGERPSVRHVRQLSDRDVYKGISKEQAANTISPQQISILLRNILKRGSPVQANRAHAYLHAAFRYGLHHDNDPARKEDAVRFFMSSNPVEAVPKPHKDESPGERDLSAHEIRTVWKSLDHYDGMSIDCKRAIRLLLVTGQRVETILNAPRNEFDLDRGVWEVPSARMKKKRTHVIPLHPMAMDIIKRQFKLHDSDLLFPDHHGNDKPMLTNSLSKAVLRYCVREKFKKFTPRDLRRTWKSCTGELGLSKEIRDRIQTHAQGSEVSGKHYDRFDYLEQKSTAMTAWCEYLATIISDAKVTPIRKA